MSDLDPFKMEWIRKHDSVFLFSLKLTNYSHLKKAVFFIQHSIFLYMPQGFLKYYIYTKLEWGKPCIEYYSTVPV